MPNLRRFFLGLCLMGLNGLASAGDNVLQFSAELLLHESKQIKQAEPFKYSDPERGPALRKLLAPARAAIVINEYLAGFPQGIFEPEISRQLEPLANRYKKAFAARPKEFEEEYLDSLSWMVLFINAQRRFQRTAGQQMSKSATPTPEEEAVLSMTKSLQSLGDSVAGAMARGLIQESAQGAFSATGSNRVLHLASQLMSGSTDASAFVEPVADEPAKPAMAYAAMNADQRMLFGEDIYRKDCLACHGATGAGIPGTFPSLIGSPRLANADATIRIIMNGVPRTAMADFAYFDDDEFAAVVNYTRAKFGGLKGQTVTPADIRIRRDRPATRTPPGAVSYPRATPP